MSSGEDDFAFDNWEQAAQELAIEKQQQPKEQSDKKNEVKQKQLVEKQLPEEKIKKGKNTLAERINYYKSLSGEEFEEIFGDKFANKKMLNTSIQTILKSDKDFTNLGRNVGVRIDQQKDKDDVVDEENLSCFMEELFLYLYNDLHWRNMSEINKKIRIVKNERKTDEKKAQKEKQKEKRKKKKEQQIVVKDPIEQKPKQDELFGGVVNINSKQVDDQRKQKVVQPPKPSQESDDDFM